MGNNTNGELSDGTFDSRIYFSKVKFAKKYKFMDLEVFDACCGESHSVFIVHHLTPVALISLHWLSLIVAYAHAIHSNVISLIAEYFDHTKDSYFGYVYSCGSNSNGQLGNGVKQLINIAQPVNSLKYSNIVTVVCGDCFTLCLSTNGTLYFFGDNYYGQSGNGDGNENSCVFEPKRIEYFRKNRIRIRRISAGLWIIFICFYILLFIFFEGKSHVCAMDTFGRVYCWGMGTYGQLGVGNCMEKFIGVPCILESLLNYKIIDIRCGTYHTVVLNDEHSVFCWGSNNYGQCLQSLKEYKVLVEPMMANLDVIFEQNLVIRRIFCGYYCTLLLTEGKKVKKSENIRKITA